MDNLDRRILGELRRWDMPKKPISRQGIEYFNGNVVDVFVYLCPIEGLLRVALAGADGVYWSAPYWKQGGYFYVQSGLNWEGTQLGYDAGSMRRDVIHVLEQIGAGPCILGHINGFMWSTDDMPYSHDEDSAYTATRVNLVKTWANALGHMEVNGFPINPYAMFELSIRAARARHMKSHHSRKSRKTKEREYA
jgi:hypothetical protein